jgi:choline/ethanolamine kinase
MMHKVLNKDGEIYKRIATKLEDYQFPEAEQTLIDDIKKWMTVSEMEYLLSQLPKGPDNICFSHNDLLANNVLLVPPVANPVNILARQCGVHRF